MPRKSGSEQSKSSSPKSNSSGAAAAKSADGDLTDSLAKFGIVSVHRRSLNGAAINTRMRLTPSQPPNAKRSNDSGHLRKHERRGRRSALPGEQYWHRYGWASVRFPPKPAAKVLAGLDLQSLRERQRIVELNTQILNRALQFRMTQQQLAGAKIASLAVQHRNLRPP
jgi:hypothetical protein